MQPGLRADWEELESGKEQWAEGMQDRRVDPGDRSPTNSHLALFRGLEGFMI